MKGKNNTKRLYFHPLCSKIIDKLLVIIINNNDNIIKYINRF